VTGNATGSGSGLDCVTIKYSNAGVPIWTNIFNGAGNTDDYGKALVIDRNGNIYVTGASYNGNYYKFTTLKYSNDGLPLWTNQFNRPGGNYDRASSLAVDGNGNVYVTGQSAIGGVGGYATIKYSGPTPTSFSFITTNGNFGLANNQFSLMLTGPAGSNAVISATTNLQTWVPLVTNPLTGGTLTFTDALATNFPSRLYRATLQP
jgi:hypothetical protein